MYLQYEVFITKKNLREEEQRCVLKLYTSTTTKNFSSLQKFEVNVENNRVISLRNKVFDRRIDYFQPVLIPMMVSISRNMFTPTYNMATSKPYQWGEALTQRKK